MKLFFLSFFHNHLTMLVVYKKSIHIYEHMQMYMNTYIYACIYGGITTIVYFWNCLMATHIQYIIN